MPKVTQRALFTIYSLNYTYGKNTRLKFVLGLEV